jgi:hypothetical protein
MENFTETAMSFYSSGYTKVVRLGEGASVLVLSIDALIVVNLRYIIIHCHCHSVLVDTL